MKPSQIFQKWRAEAIYSVKETAQRVLELSKPVIKKLYWEFCWNNDEHNGELLARQLIMANIEMDRDTKIVATYIRDQVIQGTQGQKTVEAIYVFNGMRVVGKQDG